MSKKSTRPAEAESIALSDLLRRLWNHLSLRRQRQFGSLLILMLVSGVFETISLGMVLPFIGVLAAPDRILHNYPAIAEWAGRWGITNGTDLMLPMTVAFALTAFAAGGIRMFVLWVSTRLANASGADLSIDVYRRTLYQPYQVHISRNSSEVISGITSKISAATTVLYQLLTLVSCAVLLTAIMMALLAINASVAMIAAAGFGASYVLITWLFRRRLRRNAQRISDEATHVYKALQEGLGAIRDVLLDGTQPLYCEIYRSADHPARLAQGNNTFISGGPRFAMESIGMVLIAALAYILSREEAGIVSALPILGALALGAQRLLPAMQQGYSAWVNIVGSQASLAAALELLDQPVSAEALLPPPPALVFCESIRFDKVRFHYGQSGPWVLDGIDINIAKGGRVGFVGSTGSGKSTALDLLMGLMDPTHGQILVDGQPISGPRQRAWQRTIAHVPQNIYLADSSLAENIAFGVPRDNIDIERVRQAARQAQIADFIESRSQGYEALIGERGIRLSGGQRQRIGIARALYKQAAVLVFDEATSALDNATEQEVMDSIEKMSRDLTIIIVAHRLTTVKRCDTIIELGHGKVVAQGAYEYLLENSESFRKLAKTSKSKT